MIFIALLYFLPFLAWFQPSLGAYGGTLRLDLFNNFFVATIFLIHGIQLRWRDHFNFKINFTVFFLSFLGLPLLTLLFPKFYLDEPFVTGLIILSCLPITAASCVSLTKMAGGDHHVALFGALSTNLLGTVITPLLLTVILGLSMNPLPIIVKLVLLVALPLLLGKGIATLFPKLKSLPHIFVTKGMLLLIVYGAFCTSFLYIQKYEISFGLLLGVTSALHLLFLAVAFVVGRFFSKEEAIALMFTVPQKTVVVGIPLVLGINESDFAFYALPLLLYNNIQWLTAGALLIFYKK